MSPVPCLLSPVNGHLTTILCSFSYYETSRRFNDLTAEGLVIGICPIMTQRVLCGYLCIVSRGKSGSSWMNMRQSSR